MVVGAPEASTRERQARRIGIDVGGRELTCEVEGVTGRISRAFQHTEICRVCRFWCVVRTRQVDR